MRRKDELCAQLEAEATASQGQHHQQLTSLCGRINTLENDLKLINEEDCVREWRRLRLSLDHWVKRNFKDAAKLGQLDYIAILQSIGTTTAQTEALAAGNNYQRWAILQAWITKTLHDHIFLYYCPGLSIHENQLFVELDRLILEQSVWISLSKNFTNRHLGSFNTWKHCKSGINTALNAITKPSQAMLIEQLVTHVESKLGEYTSTVPNNRQRRQQLHSIVSQCADFQIMCNQQPQMYRFVSSPSGHTVDMTCMTAAAGIFDCSETTVALSLWPSLWKEDRSGNACCLGPEFIWTPAL
jgi:hypothetical protein